MYVYIQTNFVLVECAKLSIKKKCTCKFLSLQNRAKIAAPPPPPLLLLLLLVLLLLLLNLANLAKFNFVVVCPRESIFPWYSLQLRSICLVSVCMYVYIYKLTFYLWNVKNCQSKCTCKFPIWKNRGKFAAPPITTTKFS